MAPTLEKPLFSWRKIRALVIPLMIEQTLNSLMGTADSLMVSMIDEASISAVSLVDSINLLVIMAFTAMAAGGSGACAQRLGMQDREKASDTGVQLMLLMAAVSLLVAAPCLVWRKGLLRLIFGRVDRDVMEKSITYFTITVLSYPFAALFQAMAAVDRADGNSNYPMLVSFAGNILNIAGNYVLIFVLDMGLAGAAWATTGSRVVCAALMAAELRRPKGLVNLAYLRRWRWNLRQTPLLLRMGVPFGVENGMFQLGKLAVQSTVSAMGTVAISAQAITATLEAFNSTMAAGVGIAMISVVGQCVGARRMDEARRWMLRMTGLAEATIVLSCLATWLPIHAITAAAKLTPEGAALCKRMLLMIVLVKPFLWAPAFVPVYGMRAAGDGAFAMTVSTLSMWGCRVALTVALAHWTSLGPVCVWLGMFTDWFVRAVIVVWRFYSNRWLKNCAGQPKITG